MIGVRIVLYFACLVMLLWGVLGFSLRGRRTTVCVGIALVGLTLLGRWLVELPAVSLTPSYMIEPGTYMIVAALWILLFVLIKKLRVDQWVCLLLLYYRFADFLNIAVLRNWWKDISLITNIETSLVFLLILCLMTGLLWQKRCRVHEAITSIRRTYLWIVVIILGRCHIDFVFGYDMDMLADGTWEYIMDSIEENEIHCAEINFAIALLCMAVLAFIWIRQVLQEKDHLNLQCIQQQTVQYQALYENQQALRSFRHDVRGHMTALQGLAERNDMAGIVRYLDCMGHTQAVSDRVLQVNHVIGDAILNVYRQRGEKDDIDVSALGHFQKDLRISEIDMCVILGNLMENAYTAALDTPTGHDRFILLAIGNSDALLQISVTNSLDPKKLHVIDGKLHSTKDDKMQHGIGLQNVEQVIRRYHGDMRWSLEKDDTEIKIVITIPKNQMTPT